MAELDPQVIRWHHRESIGPLDDRDAATVAEHIVEAELDELRLALEPIEIRVPHDQPAIGVLVDERERRAVGAGAAECGDEARGERRLAGAELADERDRITATDERRA